MRRTRRLSVSNVLSAGKVGRVIRTRLQPLAVSFLLVGLALSACSSREAAEGRYGNSDPTTTTTPATTSPIDDPGRLPANLQEILEQVAQIRGLSFPPELNALVIERGDLAPLLDSLYTPEDLEWFADTTTLYRLLGHFRADQDFLSIFQSFGVQAVLGLYAPDRDTLWVVVEDEDEGFGDLNELEESTLVHEFVHAIQDFHFNLDEVYLTVFEDLDRNLAWAAVIEGDAVTHERRYKDEYVALRRAGVTVLLASGAFFQTTDIPQSIIRELYFPYTTGANSVASMVDRGDTGLVNELLANPPLGTSVVMHPELLASGWRPRNVTLPDLADALGDGWVRESGGALGEFNLQNYLSLTIRSDVAAEAAKGWFGDHYDVYASDEGSLAVFRVAFESVEEANEMRAALEDVLKVVRAEITDHGAYRLASLPSGRGYAIFASPAEEVLFAIASTPELAGRIAELVAE